MGCKKKLQNFAIDQNGLSLSLMVPSFLSLQGIRESPFLLPSSPHQSRKKPKIEKPEGTNLASCLLLVDWGEGEGRRRKEKRRERCWWWFPARRKMIPKAVLLYCTVRGAFATNWRPFLDPCGSCHKAKWQASWAKKSRIEAGLKKRAAFQLHFFLVPLKCLWQLCSKGGRGRGRETFFFHEKKES